MTRARIAPADAGGGTADLGTTSTGLPPRVVACLAYSTWWVSGALVLAAEPANRFVRFHAWQATLVFGGLWLVGLALWATSFVMAFVSPLAFKATAVLAPLTWGVGGLVWVVCLWQAGHGRWFALPWLGPWVVARTGGPRGANAGAE